MARILRFKGCILQIKGKDCEIKLSRVTEECIVKICVHISVVLVLISAQVHVNIR
ncbi:hypothetical protein M758_1G035700 [Ceratodon purpureus]|nr:hypothetical protein M758_1G035700 [Ceratodon purpureus]